jgi:hypothetical protein
MLRALTPNPTGRKLALHNTAGREKTAPPSCPGNRGVRREQERKMSRPDKLLALMVCISDIPLDVVIEVLDKCFLILQRLTLLDSASGIGYRVIVPCGIPSMMHGKELEFVRERRVSHFVDACTRAHIGFNVAWSLGVDNAIHDGIVGFRGRRLDLGLVMECSLAAAEGLWRRPLSEDVRRMLGTEYESGPYVLLSRDRKFGFFSDLFREFVDESLFHSGYSCRPAKRPSLFFRPKYSIEQNAHDLPDQVREKLRPTFEAAGGQERHPDRIVGTPDGLFEVSTTARSVEDLLWMIALEVRMGAFRNKIKDL